MRVSEIEIRPVPYADPVAQQLIAEAVAELIIRYGGDGDDAPIDQTQFTPPQGEFLVAFADGEALGCTGWRTHDTEIAELKRMFIRPQARGRGAARALLRAAEDSARERGFKRLYLESGDRQPEALALYASAGYDRIPNFGHHREHPSCVSFGRVL